MDIKCHCGDTNCKTGINICKEGMFLTSKSGEENLMYIDSNQLVALINELREILIERTKE